jgi:Ca-activated chloride channel homolog
MVAMRPIAMVVMTALLSGQATPIMADVQRQPRHETKEADSPVRCNRGEGEWGMPIPRKPTPLYQSRVKQKATMADKSRAEAAVNVAPPPPPQIVPSPAPPPPPPSSAQVMSGSVPVAGRVAVPQPYPLPYPRPAAETGERYAGKDVASIHAVADQPVSTFSVDVDTGAYANVRRFLMQGQMPPVAAVRTEELLNYFRYDYAAPRDRTRPFSLTTDVAVTPWNPETRLMRVGIKGYDLPRAERPATNLVFLVDVSGSMMSDDKLPLVKTSLSMLADRLGPSDRVSIVVYAGAAGIVLEPTSNANHVKQALDCLQAGGSTAGGQGMELAYATARANFVKGGVNRVIMATDGDFNVGISSQDGIEAIVKKNRESGITLTTLGFGQGNYNEAMMERVADIGNGNYAYIDSAFEAQKVLDEEMASTIFTIAKDVKIQIEFNPDVVREYRLIGYENRLLAEEDFNNDKVDAGDIGSGHQVTALYEIVPASAKGWLPERRYDANRAVPSPRTVQTPTEIAWLKLRYKLPDGDKSALVEQPVSYGLFQNAGAPRGDMAFAAAVAAFGQKMRGDKYLGGFGYADVRALAGSPNGYLREEFVKLTRLAESQSRGGLAQN